MGQTGQELLSYYLTPSRLTDRNRLVEWHIAGATISRNMALWLQHVELGLRRRRPLSAHRKPHTGERRTPLAPSLHANVSHNAELAEKHAEEQRAAAEAMWRDWRQQKDCELRERQRATAAP